MTSIMTRGDGVLLVVAGVVVTLLFLAASFALLTIHLRMRHERKAARWRRLEAEWEPLILDVLDGAAPPSLLADAVSAGDRLFFVGFLLRYHRRLSGEGLEVLHDLARPHLPLVRSRLGARLAETRARAVRTLAELGLPDHLDAVVEALDDSSPLVQMAATRAILENRLGAAYADVIDRLQTFSGWRRHYLASMLASAGTRMAPLLGEVAGDRSRATRDRAVALDALRELHDLEAVGSAAEILELEHDRELTLVSLRLIADLGYGEQAEIVRRYVDSSDPLVRAAAVSALGAVGAAEDLEFLTAAVDDSSAWVALKAAQGLKRMGARGVLLRIAAGGGAEAVLAQQVLVEDGTP